MNKKPAIILPVFLAFAWILWYSVQGRWSEVIVPNWHWLLLTTIIAIRLLYLITRRKAEKSLVNIQKSEVPEEKIIAKETIEWKIIKRERSLYAKPK